MSDDLRSISVVLFDGFELLDVFGPVDEAGRLVDEGMWLSRPGRF